MREKKSSYCETMLPEEQPYYVQEVEEISVTDLVQMM